MVVSLYHRFKDYGGRPIPAYASNSVERGGQTVIQRHIVNDTDVATWSMLDEIITAYGPYSGSQLAAMTMAEGSAWHSSGAIDGEPIPNKLLADCFVDTRKNTPPSLCLVYTSATVLASGPN